MSFGQCLCSLDLTAFFLPLLLPEAESKLPSPGISAQFLQYGQIIQNTHHLLFSVQHSTEIYRIYQIFGGFLFFSLSTHFYLHLYISNKITSCFEFCRILSLRALSDDRAAFITVLAAWSAGLPKPPQKSLWAPEAAVGLVQTSPRTTAGQLTSPVFLTIMVKAVLH